MAKSGRGARELGESAEALLAEHDRLSALYLHNAEMGEKRTSLYLTVISGGIAILVGLGQFGADTAVLRWPAFGLLAVLLLIGLLTFQRLIERRIRGTEYLRAINRIHRYFVDRDPDLGPYFYWPACDDLPAFASRGATMEGLRDLIALLNSLFIGVLLGQVLAVLLAGRLVGIAAAVGLVTAVLSWTWHQAYERRSLRRMETSSSRWVLFPLED